jgi:Ribosomal protein L11 methyltransferase (PrmA)
VIRPSWEPVALQAQDIEIVLDPKQAFGTGHHATARMLLEWLEDLVHGGESVLDVGAGGGILAMVALRLGAAWPSEWNATLLRWIVHETMPQRTGLRTISSSGAENAGGG